MDRLTIGNSILSIYVLKNGQTKNSTHSQASNMEEKAPTVGQLSSGLVGEDPEAGVETVDIERIEKVYR